MIEGLKIRKTGSQIRALCVGRVAYHEAKRAKYASALTSITSAVEDDGPAMSRDPQRDVRAKVTEHEQRREYFTHVAEGIEDNELYQITEAELRQLLGIDRSSW